jgi:molybdenum cofactor cytidylyltransferase
MQQDKLTAIVLAAGYCRRMGSFKPLLELDGSPVISFAVDSLLKAGIRDIHVVAGYNSEALLPVLAELRVRSVINNRFAEGMFTSVLAGIDSLGPGKEAFFLLPADMPLIRPETIKYIMQMHGEHPGKIVVPSFGGRKGHPPLIPVEFVDYIRGYTGENGLSGALWSMRDKTVFIPVDDENTVFDFDTTERYTELQERWQRIKKAERIEVQKQGSYGSSL